MTRVSRLSVTKSWLWIPTEGPMCLFYKMAAKINWKSPTFQLQIFINKAAIIFPSKYLQLIKCFPSKMATVSSQIKLMCIKLTRVKIWKHCMLAKGKKQEKNVKNSCFQGQFFMHDWRVTHRRNSRILMQLLMWYQQNSKWQKFFHFAHCMMCHSHSVVLKWQVFFIFFFQNSRSCFRCMWRKINHSWLWTNRPSQTITK